MHRVFLFIIIVFLFSCANERSMNDPGVPVHVLIDSIENYGNINAFNKLETASLDYRPGEFLSTFLIMADKYNNASACMTVYYHVVWMYHVPLIEKSQNGIYQLDSLNNDTRTMAIKYLIKANSLGNKEAKNHLLEYKQIGMIK